MNRRDQIRMSEAEVWAFLDQPLTLQVATINRDGSPHLVAMFYAVLDGEITFWTYARSQKVRNLERDERITVLAEDGRSYDELRGVQVQGRARLSRDPDRLQVVGEAIYRRYYGELEELSRQGIEHASRKRVAVTVVAERTISWDHSKLG